MNKKRLCTKIIYYDYVKNVLNLEKYIIVFFY